MTQNIKDFYIPNSERFSPVEGFPYLVVGVSNEPVGRFTNAVAAEMFLEKAFEFYGRIIDTREEA